MLSLRLRRASLSLGFPRIPYQPSYDYIELRDLTSSEHGSFGQSSSHTTTSQFLNTFVPRFSTKETAARLRQLQKERMERLVEQGKDIETEARKSFGVGGAGNIRRPSEVIYPIKMKKEWTRRSSIWSILSLGPDTKRASYLRFLNRRSST
ncbi:hypothetical protein B0O99DRAFT_163910 [Bisporella sp. PMI_857]|nr:hypothetical protein B0O99DRAFT_163910 [Bisporella sp. PMI_857]